MDPFRLFWTISMRKICQLQFFNIFRIDIVQNNLKGSKMYFSLIMLTMLFYKTEKLTFVSSVFEVHLFVFTNIPIFRFRERTYHSLLFAFFGILFFFTLNVLSITHPPFTSSSVLTSIIVSFENILIITLLYSIFSFYF